LNWELGFEFEERVVEYARKEGRKKMIEEMDKT